MRDPAAPIARGRGTGLRRRPFPPAVRLRRGASHHPHRKRTSCLGTSRGNRRRRDGQRGPASQHHCLGTEPCEPRRIRIGQGLIAGVELPGNVRHLHPHSAHTRGSPASGSTCMRSLGDPASLGKPAAGGRGGSSGDDLPSGVAERVSRLVPRRRPRGGCEADLVPVRRDGGTDLWRPRRIWNCKRGGGEAGDGCRAGRYPHPHQDSRDLLAATDHP